MAELSVCDSFFVSFPTSTVAMAAIVNVMEDMPTSKLSTFHRTAFWTLVQERFGFTLDPSRTLLGAQLEAARQRLRAMYTTATAAAGAPTSSAAGSAAASQSYDDDTRMETVDGRGSSYHNHYSQHQPQAAAPSPSSPTSTTEMNVDDAATIGSSTLGDYGGRDVSGCVEVEWPHPGHGTHNSYSGRVGTVKIATTTMNTNNRATNSPHAGGDTMNDGDYLATGTSERCDRTSPNDAPDSNNLRYSPSPLSSEHQQPQNLVPGAVPASLHYSSSQEQYQHRNIFSSTSSLNQMNCSPIVSETQ
jgi:hypothetical protein